VRTVFRGAQIFLILFVAAHSARAQQVPGNFAFRTPLEIRQASTPSSTLPAKGAVQTHRFWDRENILWFAGVGAARGLDYSSTLNLRRRGDDEVFLNNSIVDNHPLFAGIEAAATITSVGVSYLFHRTGHHRLERWTSAVHFGLTVGGALRNYALPTQHKN
jgi:hypothetical protein